VTITVATNPYFQVDFHDATAVDFGNAVTTDITAVSSDGKSMTVTTPPKDPSDPNTVNVGVIINNEAGRTFYVYGAYVGSQNLVQFTYQASVPSHPGTESFPILSATPSYFEQL
jgi:hypothetical protein